MRRHGAIIPASILAITSVVAILLMSTSEGPAETSLEETATAPGRDEGEPRGLAALRIASQKTKAAVNYQEDIKAQVSHHLLHSMIIRQEARPTASASPAAEEHAPLESREVAKLLEQASNPDWLNPGNDLTTHPSKKGNERLTHKSAQLPSADFLTVSAPVVEKVLPVPPGMAKMPPLPAMPPIVAKHSTKGMDKKLAAIKRFAMTHIGVSEKEYAKMEPLIKNAIVHNHGNIPTPQLLNTAVTQKTTVAASPVKEKVVDDTVEHVLLKSGHILKALGVKMDDPVHSKDPLAVLQKNSAGIVNKVQALQALQVKKIEKEAENPLGVTLKKKTAPPSNTAHPQLVTSTQVEQILPAPSARKSANDRRKQAIQNLKDDSPADDEAQVESMVTQAKREAKAELAHDHTRADVLDALHKAASAVALPPSSPNAKTRSSLTQKEVLVASRVAMKAHNKRVRQARMAKAMKGHNHLVKKIQKSNRKAAAIKEGTEAIAVGEKHTVQHLNTQQLKALVAAAKRQSAKEATTPKPSTLPTVQGLDTNKLKALVAAAKKAAKREVAKATQSS